MSLCIHICDKALFFRSKAHLAGCIKYDNSPNGRLEQEECSFSVILPLYFHKGWVNVLAARSSFVLVSDGRACPYGFTGPMVLKGWRADI